MSLLSVKRVGGRGEERSSEARYRFNRLLKSLNGVGTFEVDKLDRFHPCGRVYSGLAIKTKMLKNKDFSCFQTLRCCIYNASKC